jgi:hypothetical protein
LEGIQYGWRTHTTSRNDSIGLNGQVRCETSRSGYKCGRFNFLAQGPYEKHDNIMKSMTIYRTVEDMRGLRRWTRLIERVSPGQETIQFAFKGTKEEAEAEAVRLTKLLSTRST